MLYKPYGLAGACEDDARFSIVVFHENRDAAKKVMVHKSHDDELCESSDSIAHHLYIPY